jgi:putative ABC transport system substrate-binding protein
VILAALNTAEIKKRTPIRFEPLAARAQQGERVRRIGVLIPFDENSPIRSSQPSDDPRQKTDVSEFAQALADLGWADGRNVRMDVR